MQTIIGMILGFGLYVLENHNKPIGELLLTLFLAGSFIGLIILAVTYYPRQAVIVGSWLVGISFFVSVALAFIK